jgi:hypothetical protein
MPGYIKKKIQEYGHLVPNRMQKCPYSPESKKFGSNAQAPLPPNDKPKLDLNRIICKKKSVGSILYYPQAVDMMVLMALSSIAIKQMKVTGKTIGKCIQLLDYLATNEMAKIRFHASEIILNIKFDVSYLQRPEPAAEHVDISSWAGCQKTTNRYVQMGCSTRTQQ